MVHLVVGTCNNNRVTLPLNRNIFYIESVKITKHGVMAWGHRYIWFLVCTNRKKYCFLPFYNILNFLDVFVLNYFQSKKILCCDGSNWLRPKMRLRIISTAIFIYGNALSIFMYEKFSYETKTKQVGKNKNKKRLFVNGRFA